MENQESILAEQKKKYVLLSSISMGHNFKNIEEKLVASDVCKYLTTKVTEEFITWMKERDRLYENRGNFELRNKYIQLVIR